MTDLIVAGAGMAGLAAAARARELGAEVEMYEKAGRVGGSMLLSSGVIWRYATFQDFRAECPDGDEALQRVVHEQLDRELDWLEGLGAVVTEPSTGNSRTSGRRFDTRSICAALLRTGPILRLTHAATARASAGADAAPDASAGADAAPDGPAEPDAGASAEPDAFADALASGVPCVLATGGFQADSWLVREWISAEPLLVRSNMCSVGDGLRIGIEAGGVTSAGMDQFYGRAMPAVQFLHETHWVTAAQLLARYAVEIVNASGHRYEGEVDWPELKVVQWIARQRGARAWFVVPESALGEPTRYGTVGEQIERARGLGAAVERRDREVAVEVRAAITQTLGGLRIDTDGRVLRVDGSAVPGLFAAGGDAGGVATGGYMSNLAAALVIGKRAAEAALS